MANLENVVKRLEAVATKLESVASGSAKASASDDSTEIVDAFDEIIVKHISKLQQLTDAIGTSELKELVKLVAQAFNHERSFLVTVSKFGAPRSGIEKLLKPTSEAISAAQALREKNRTSKQFNHLSALSEWIPVLGWVTVTKGATFVKDTANGFDFYGNRILKEFKGNDDRHVDWVKTVKSITGALVEYTKQHHPGGLAWKVGGEPAPTSGAPAGPPPPPAVGAPPPPPVGAPAPAASGNAPDMSALFSSLNKGTNVTSGLKKVDPSMQTHKNPNLRAGATVPAKVIAKSAAPTSTAAAKTSAPKPPVLERVGKKWVVENHVGNKSIVLSDTTMKEAVYVYKCNDCVIQIKNKVNAITLDSCKKTGVVFHDVLSTCEFVNCQSVKAQANGKVPTISIDKTDGCILYLSSKSVDAEIVTAKSSEMNVAIVAEDGDMKEYPIPEQYKTVYTGKGLKTEASDIAM